MFTKIDTLNIDFKKLLKEDFKVVYIESKQINKENIEENIKNNLALFKIEKKRESIFLKITSIDKLDEVKKEIKSEYEKFLEEFLSYFDRVEDKLDEKNIKSFEIIEKIIKNRAKKLDGIINKFSVEESWGIAKIQEEFYFKIQKNLADLVDSLVPTISTGSKENSAYNGILSSLNTFLSQLGIYTIDIDIDKACNYEFVNPQECDDCETEDINKKDRIKEILSYPYVLNDNQIVVEGRVILWKVVYNG